MYDISNRTISVLSDSSNFLKQVEKIKSPDETGMFLLNGKLIQTQLTLLLEDLDELKTKSPDLFQQITQKEVVVSSELITINRVVQALEQLSSVKKEQTSVEKMELLNELRFEMGGYDGKKT